MSYHFNETEKAVQADAALAARATFLSVTLDPAFDTPEVLAGYAGHLCASHLRAGLLPSLPAVKQSFSRAACIPKP